MEVTANLRNSYCDPASQRQITFIVQQTEACQMHCNQRGGTTGLNNNAWTFQVELVGKTGGHEIFIVGNEDLKTAWPFKQIQPRGKIAQQVGVPCHTGIYADQPLVLLRR